MIQLNIDQLNVFVHIKQKSADHWLFAGRNLPVIDYFIGKNKLLNAHLLTQKISIKIIITVETQYKHILSINA